jgi:hypothetical protein
MGGIAEAQGSGLHSSERIRVQPNADLTQMERAQQQGAACMRSNTFLRYQVFTKFCYCLVFG